MEELTRDRLKELIHYDPETGVCTWKVNRRGKARAGVVISFRNTEGYIRTTIDAHEYLLHRLIFFYMTGKFPAQVDHKNRIRTDNRWDNLREATSSQNMANKEMHPRNTSGFRGVCWHKRKKKWQAQIQVENKSVYLGMYERKDAAIAACEQALQKSWGEYYSPATRFQPQV